MGLRSIANPCESGTMPLWVLLLALWPAERLRAQPESRAEEIEAARDGKQQKLSPEAPDKWERRLLYMKEARLVERFTFGYYGFRASIGQMATGSGFAFGPEYFRQDLAGGTLAFRASAAASTRRWVKLNTTFGAPRLFRNHAEWYVQTEHHNYNSIDYYGSGPDSKEESRTNYRLEDTAIDTRFMVRPWRWLGIGASGGYLLMNIGPGQGETPSTDQIFSPTVTPGLDQQTDFWRYGPLASINYLDSPAGPRSGGLYTLRYDIYRDRKLRLFSFERLEVDLQQYIPLFNKRRVIALRGKAATTTKGAGQQVPFYFQNVLGGANDLRGFAQYRFYGDQMVLLNAEWRWEAFPALDVAFFGDAGKVSERSGDIIRFKGFETTLGFGFRFNVRNATFMRLDFGFSREGFRFWFKFNDIYGKLPLGQSSPLHVY